MATSELAHVRWIGGGSGAGKSTISRLLATTHGLRVHGTDDTIADHVRRSTPAQLPLLHAFVAMGMDERWVTRPPSVMFETFHGFHGEGFELIIEDLIELPDDPPILVEGFRLLPRLVAPLLSRPDQAVWLAPSPEFRRSAFESRGSTWEIPGRTRDPERALANLLARDELFTAELATEAAALRLPVIQVEVDHSVEYTSGLVAWTLGLPPPG